MASSRSATWREYGGLIGSIRVIIRDLPPLFLISKHLEQGIVSDIETQGGAMAARLPRPGGPVRGSATGRPLMAAMDLLGRRWALRILWELRDKPLGARALRSRCDRMSSSVLYERLDELTAAGLLTRDEEGAYLLTELGSALGRRSSPWTPGRDAGRRRCRRLTVRDRPPGIGRPGMVRLTGPAPADAQSQLVRLVSLAVGSPQPRAERARRCPAWQRYAPDVSARSGVICTCAHRSGDWIGPGRPGP